MEFRNATTLNRTLWTVIKSEKQQHRFYRSGSTASKNPRFIGRNNNTHNVSVCQSIIGTGVAIDDDGEAQIKIYTKDLLDDREALYVLERLAFRQSLKKSVIVENIGNIVAAISADVIYPGVSVGHITGGFGTLGCVVKKDERLYLLGNNHVLARCNTFGEERRIIQPGMEEQVTAKELDKIADKHFANLIDYIPLQMLNMPLADDRPQLANYVDAAIAEPLDWERVNSDNLIPGHGRISKEVLEFTEGQEPMEVYKRGAKSGESSGIIFRTTNVNIEVDYGIFGKAEFVNQLEIRGMDGYFGRKGDSGSLVFAKGPNETTVNPIGLLFAVSEKQNVAFANPINNVLTSLGVTLI